MKGKKSVTRGVKYAIIVVLAAISLFPILVLVTTSFKTQAEAFTIPPVWLFLPTVGNYLEVLFRGRFLRYLSNSAVVALFSAIFILIIGALAAYSLSRFRFLGRGVFSVFTLTLRMIAPAVLVVPLFALWGCLIRNLKTARIIIMPGKR